jgi:glutathione synthase/RimK-type ligase-like ATP-grasp enzyme
MILIISNVADEHADHVSLKLRARGIEFYRFNTLHFPTEVSISVLTQRSDNFSYRIIINGDSIELNSIDAVWYRRPERPEASSTCEDVGVRQYIGEESITLFDNIWETLDCLFIPAKPHLIRRAELKLLQFKVAREVNFEIPQTLTGNDTGSFMEFYRDYNGRVITKTLGSALSKFFRDTYDNQFIRYTEVVTKRSLAYAKAIRLCPLVFQAYIPKKIELRITVVGEQVFAAEIHSQESRHSRHDWRRYDLNSTPHYPHNLPNEVADSCISLVKRLGLCYGAIDMILTPDGRYVFLEINPNGQYLWIEQLTGLPISDAICDMLAASRHTNQQ